MTPTQKEMFAERVRQFERRLQANMKDIFVPVHLSLGQEYVAADLLEYMVKEDYLFSTHRNHHHYLAKGGSEQKLWDEIMGLPSGVNQGFSGSQGISDKSINFHASAIVGGLVGVAVGTAYALKMDKAPGIAICCVGDAGTEAGVFWESLNFASLHQLPVAFIVENNGMSVDSPIADRQATPLPQRVEAFGIDVRRTVGATIMSARNNRPAFCEVKVKLACDHINMGAMLPKEVIA